MTAADEAARPVPTAEEVAQATAYMTGAMYGLGLLLEDWTGLPDGSATTTDAEGNRLVYTGDELHPFDAIIPCAQHGRHRVGFTWPHELDQVIADTAECSAKAQAQDTATTALRLVPTPTPLHLIARAAEADADREQPAS